jgi:hypothetical protein
MNYGIVVLFMLWSLGLGMAIAKHGQPRRENYNAWITLLAILIEVGILWWAGLFN